MSMRREPFRICVCTTYVADGEPRAPRHAAALAELLGNKVEVIFIDAAAFGTELRPPKIFADLSNLKRLTHRFHSKKSDIVALLVNRLRRRVARFWCDRFGILYPIAFGERVAGFTHQLTQARADVYLAHTIEGLLPAALAARGHGAKLMFDAMEFYTDMDHNQSASERAMVRALEAEWLPHCALILASSDQMADELFRVYGIARPLPLYNVPYIEAELPAKAAGFHLYWRNAVIGLGQRGLEEALRALRDLPSDVTLHLQGRLQVDGGASVRARIDEFGIGDRVIFHPPYLPENAVKEAAVHTVGLCLERRGVRNHELTVSNKMFDYHMAGLAVISSDLPSLRAVIERSGGGLLYEAGSADDLGRQVMALYNDPARLDRLSAKARAFALSEGNWEHERKRYVTAFQASVH